ncbi:hypothetical protein [Micromonospora sp. DT231]|uniref:hypothetical protein n=1 Tax=Micromonospora sp. DT231 TaxID=3416526 RepID=UPI003CE90C7C
MTASATLRAALDRLRTMGDSPRVVIARAEAEFRLGVHPETNAGEGIELLRSAVRHDPFLAKGFLHLGLRLHRAGRFRAAVPEYLAALELAPASRRVHLLLAEALLELGKAEQQAGDELIAALAAREPERLKAAVAEIGGVLTGGEPDAEAEAAGENEKEKKKPRRRAKPPTDLTGVWQVWLLAQLSRAAKRAQPVACLKAGATRIGVDGPADVALGCLMLLLSGDPPAEVRKEIAAAGVDPEAGNDPALRALAAALELAEAGDPVLFVRGASEHLLAGVLPVAVVCALHYQRFGPSAAVTVTDALRLLDVYPSAVRDDHWFQELRIAVLDGYATRAWTDGALGQARLLWRETVGLDPYRVPVAVNLALVAARMKAAEEYGPAWERLFELTYLLAGGVGDVQLLLDERRDLHLALTRQSWQRHCGSAPPSGTPTEDDLDAWVADGDALAVWLRHWDSYYLNARLSFRSPVHLLGTARDVDTDELAEARDALVALADTAVVGRDWAGGKAFRELVAGLAEDAYAQSADPVDRARDRYYETEKPRADRLAEELLQRTLVLISLLRALGRVPVAAAREGQAAAVIRHQRSLPRRILQSIFVNRGLVQDDIELAAYVEQRVLELAGIWSRAEPSTEADRNRQVARLGEIVEALPDRLALRAAHCDALLQAKRPGECYRAAVAALQQPSTDPPADVEHYRTVLTALIDRIGYEDIPEEALRPGDMASAELAVQRISQSLERYPASGAPYVLLASLLLQMGGEQRQRRAARVLVDGILGAPAEETLPQMWRMLDDIPRPMVTGVATSACARIRGKVLDRLSAGGGPELLDEATRCRELARRFGLDGELAAFDELLAQLGRRRDGGE